jgi:hypothetical protein
MFNPNIGQEIRSRIKSYLYWFWSNEWTLFRITNLYWKIKKLYFNT